MASFKLGNWGSSLANTGSAAVERDGLERTGKLKFKSRERPSFKPAFLRGGVDGGEVGWKNGENNN